MSNAQVIPCPFCNGKDSGGCWFCDGKGTAFADHGPHLEHDEDCGCDDCTESRRLFNEWCDNTEARWEKARQERHIAHLCKGLLCPVCGDPRLTSIDVVREAAVTR